MRNEKFNYYLECSYYLSFCLFFRVNSKENLFTLKLFQSNWKYYIIKYKKWLSMSDSLLVHTSREFWQLLHWSPDG